jgi:hypothetical protein
MKLFLAALAATAFATSAMAGTTTTTVSKIVSTTQTNDPWTVYEVSNEGAGSLTSAPAQFYSEEMGYPTITMPSAWTDNDGFWYATTTFTLPANATKPTLAIASLFADDRVVVELNGNIVASTGYYAPGAGQMVFTDGGDVTNFNFATAQGAKVNHITSGFITGGVNTITLIVNNTDQGIDGPLLGGVPGGATEVGMTARVIYNVPAAAPDTSALTKSMR